MILDLIETALAVVAVLLAMQAAGWLQLLWERWRDLAAR